MKKALFIFCGVAVFVISIKYLIADTGLHFAADYVRNKIDINNTANQVSIHNKNIEQTISSSRPPIFWKDKQIVKNQITNWKVSEVENLIINIKNLEIDVKKHASSSLNLVFDFILNTASANN